MKPLHAIAIICCCLVSTAYGVSFDCAKATAPPESLICADAGLSRLDDNLKSAYDKVLAAFGGSNSIKRWQRAWLVDRKTCKDSMCLKKAYTERLSELNELSTTDPRMMAIAGEYERYFRGKPDKHSASMLVLPLAGNRVRVIGNALWVGNPDTGNVNMGDIDGRFPLAADSVHYQDQDDGCSFVIKFSSAALTISDDSMRCGGMNVTFDGQYRKVSK